MSRASPRESRSLSRVSGEPQSSLHSEGKTDCGRRSPVVFFQGLDNPELEILNIKFRYDTTATMFLDIVTAAHSSCRLENLTELILAGGGWFSNCYECGTLPPPSIKPMDLRAAMMLLLPLNRLKTLRLSVAPNFLDILDLELYKSIAEGLPVLEKLGLGHAQFSTSSLFSGAIYHERVPLHHLAAFCSRLPNLTEVSIGTVDGLTLEENPCKDWACRGVKSLRIGDWARRSTSGGVSLHLALLGLRTYFPSSDLAQTGLSERSHVFG